MITHSDDGPFWTVVKRRMEAACTELGINRVWAESVNNPDVQAQLIDTAISEGLDGIAASLPSPDQLIGPLKTAVNGGIPVITLNSGANDYAAIGATTHVGQTEFIAGQGAGVSASTISAPPAGLLRSPGRVERGARRAVRRPCRHLRRRRRCPSSSGLDARRRRPKQANAIAAALPGRKPGHRRLHGRRPGHRSLGSATPRRLTGTRRSPASPAFRHHTRDHRPPSTPVTIQPSLIDQQQYLQGYLPILLLFLERATNHNTAGGGHPILTGPGFVDPGQRFGSGCLGTRRRRAPAESGIGCRFVTDPARVKRGARPVRAAPRALKHRSHIDHLGG